MTSSGEPDVVLLDHRIGKATLRRELLRWRDLVAALYGAANADPRAHDEALSCLLRFTPEASRQLAFLEPSDRVRDMD